MVATFKMSDAVVRAGVVVISMLLRQELEKKKTKKKKRIWVRDWIASREKYGTSSTLIKELIDEDTAAYRNLLRMDVVQFDNLLQMVYKLIKSIYTNNP